MNLNLLQQAELRDLVDAVCEDESSPAITERLEALLLSDDDACRYYFEYISLHGALMLAEGQETAGSPAIDGEAGFGVRESGIGIQSSGSLSVGAAVELPHQLDLESQIPEPRTPNPEPPFPSLSTTHYPLSTTHYPLPTSDFVGSWAFSCMVSAVIVCVMLLVFWAMKVTHHQHIAEAPASAPSEARQEMVFVGRITGMVDCKWSDPSNEAFFNGASVPLGRKYTLASGLMQITYDSGAKVILQGPCIYEVESTSGGYLALGKLTARIGERGEGRGEREKHSDNQQSAIINHNSPSPLSPLPSPLFSVRTPTAIVTDLGTEFAVEVAADGTGEVHVLEGEVITRSLIAGKGDDDSVHLKAGQAVRIEPNSGKITAMDFAAKGFVRNLRIEAGRKIEAAYVRGVLADEPLAYWPLNEPAKERRFMDRSGNGFHGRAVGEVRSGRPGPLSTESRSVEFDGQGHIDVGRHDQFSLVNGFTVEAWILAEHSTVPTRVISADNAVSDSTMRTGWSLAYVVEPHNSFANGFPCLAFTAHAVKNAAFNTVVTPTSRWIHVAVVFDRNNIAHLFQDGRPRSSVDVGGPAKVGPARLSIGAMSSKSHFWKGRLAHVAVYPRELSEERIREHRWFSLTAKKEESGKEDTAMNGP